MERKLVFNNNEITFDLTRDNGMMINATEMAKVFGRQASKFLENEGTRLFIESCLKKQNSAFLNVNSEDELYVSKQSSGTWMHRILALKFAAWLDPDFEVWVYSTIEDLLFGNLVEREKSLQKTVALQAEMNVIVENRNRTAEDFDRYLQIQSELNREKYLRLSLTKESMSGMNELFDFPAGNLPSLTDVIITVSKSKTLDSKTPIICKPCRGSPSKEISDNSIICL